MVSLSYIMQKIGFLEVEKTGLNGSKRKIPFFTCTWLKGFLLMFVGSLIHVAALPFCDLVVLSTSTATSIIFNTLLSMHYLGEQFDWRLDGPAFALIIGGCLAIVGLSNYGKTTYTPEIIRDLIFS